MQFIKTYYRRRDYDTDLDRKPNLPLLAYIIETGEVIYTNKQVFSMEFDPNDFEVLDFNLFKPFFNFYGDV